MQLTYKYRLKPTKAQLVTIATHLELCRRQYNYRLGERFRWWESTRTPINACPLVVSIVPVEEIYQNIPLTRVQTRDGRKKDASGNPLTRKGDVFSNIEGGYVQWQTIQLADLKNTKKLFPSLTLKDKTVPVTVAEIQPTVENTVGIDLGITNYVYLSSGERVENPSGESLDRDENSAKLIRKIGLSCESGGGTPSLKKAFAKKEKEACGLTVLR
jgi:transposase